MNVLDTGNSLRRALITTERDGDYEEFAARMLHDRQNAWGRVCAFCVHQSNFRQTATALAQCHLLWHQSGG